MSKRNDSFGGEEPDYVYIPVPVSRDRTTEPGDVAGAAGCLVALPLAVIWFVCAGLCAGLSNFVERFGFPILAVAMMLPGLIWLVWRYPKSSAAIGLPSVVLVMYYAATQPHTFLTERLFKHGVLDLQPPHSREIAELSSFQGLRFPTGIREVNCSHCPSLKSLEGLPAGIESVDCSGCTRLTSLKGLPNGVKYIWCERCIGLTSLAELPDTVKTVYCGNCPGLTSLNGLPHGVEEVNCQNCLSLMGLEGLPAGIESVDCSGCTRLTSLKGLPEGVKYIWCEQCIGLTSLAELPDTVKIVYCRGCPNLTGLDKLSARVRVIR